MFLHEMSQNTDREVSSYSAIWRQQNSSTGVHQKSAFPKVKIQKAYVLQ